MARNRYYETIDNKFNVFSEKSESMAISIKQDDMHILLAHNFYGSLAPSGENTVFLAEKNLLLSHGHQVTEFTRHSDEIRSMGIRGTITGAFSAIWNPFSYSRLRRMLIKQQPDILHVHNTFPLLSPGIFHAARGLTTATVLTLHNYRVFCAAGIPMRNNLPCTECMDHQSVFPALKYGCYRNSRMATIPMSLMITLHQQIGTWRNYVDAFIALTNFQKDKMSQAGLPRERIHLKPHFYPDAPTPLPWRERERKAVFIGRLGTEKGIHVLITAWKKWGIDAPVLEIIGDGPERGELERFAADEVNTGKIKFAGQLAFSRVQEKLSQASLIILPSLCFEGFPMVLREAFALGVPAAVSRLGAMAEIVSDGKNGILFSPGNPDDLFRKVKSRWDHPEQLAAMAHQARQEFEIRYTPEINHDMLMMIYQAAIMERKRKNCVLTGYWPLS